MTTYPKINDENFYDKIYDKFKKYRTSKTEKSFDEICFPNKYELQIQQKFIGEIMNPNSPYKGFLLFHKIGSGKTCTGIKIVENWKKKNMKVIIVVPAFLKSGWYDEFRTKCTAKNANESSEYISDKDVNIVNKLQHQGKEYKMIIKKSNNKIDKDYIIYSYNKFFDLLEKKKINLNNTLLLIDEVHNIVSEHGTSYNLLYDAIKKNPKNFKIVIMSATPMYDKPEELALTMNLLQLPKEIPMGKKFNELFIKNNTVINTKLLKQYIRGYVSYYGGTPLYTFPKMTITNVKCKMSDFQYNIYKNIIESGINNPDFFTKARMSSNIVYPNKLFESKGFISLTDNKIKSDLKKYSSKFYKMLKSIKKSEGPIFVYSTYKNYGGIYAFVKVLECFGYKNFKTNGIGKNVFAIWSSEERLSYKIFVKNTFNKKENSDGQLIKIIIGSPSIKEGVSLFRIRQVHIMEPYWNYSRLLQIMGRASRYCSHKDLPKNKRNVEIYIYLATHSSNKKTIDQYLIDMAENKKKITDMFENILKESSIDCLLFKNANLLTQKNEIKCDH